MSRVYGYARVSTEEQGRSGLGLAAQEAAILAAYPDAGIRREIASGKDAERKILQEVLAQLRRGDTLVVAKLDRLSRSVKDAGGLLEDSVRQGWALVMLDLQIDTSTPSGEAMANVMMTFARLERRLIGQRISEALAAKRAAGWEPHTWPRTVTPAFRRRILRLHEQGLSQRAIQRKLGLASKETVARILRAA